MNNQLNINQGVFTGTISKDIEVKKSQKGTVYCTFTLVNKKALGEGNNYLNCIAWKKSAQELEGLTKGTYIGIVGSVETSLSKEKQTVVNISVNRVFIDGRTTINYDETSNDEDKYSNNVNFIPNENDLPF